MARELLVLPVMSTLTNQPSTLAHRHDVVVGIARVVDYLFGLLYTLLIVRLVLEIVGARRGTGFVALIAWLTGPFYAPFRGIVPSETFDGAHPIVWPIVVALLAYILLHGAIVGLLRLVSRA
jgi:uncharacterized protein YggT (Ycf19 family)